MVSFLLCRDVNEAMKEQLLTMRHSLGERALLFRPFLKWLDRNIGPLILAASHGVSCVCYSILSSLYTAICIIMYVQYITYMCVCACLCATVAVHTVA